LASNEEEFTALKKAFQITLEGDLKNVKYISCIINQVLHSIGYSELKAGERLRKRVGGKQVYVNDFFLESEFKSSNKKHTELLNKYIEKGMTIDIYGMLYSSNDRAEEQASKKRRLDESSNDDQMQVDDE
jgi:hypothetical protein